MSKGYLSKPDIVHLFMAREAVASCALDAECVTVSEGLTCNPKLYRLGVKVAQRETGEVVWRGVLADVARQSVM